MAPTSHTYLDYYQSQDRAHEPIAIGGYLPMDTVYAYRPYPDSLQPQYRKHILGAQVQLWTEYIPTPKQAEYMAYPRTAAFSEVMWTPENRRDYADFLRRLQVHLKRLDALDVGYRRLAVLPSCRLATKQHDASWHSWARRDRNSRNRTTRAIITASFSSRSRP